MKNLTPLVSAVILGVALSGPIASAEPIKGSPSLMLSDHSISADKLIGMTVADRSGQPIGKVGDILLKNPPAEPTAILSVGGYAGTGPKLVALPLSQMRVTADRVTMPDASRQMMAAMPAFRFDGLNGGGG